MTRLIGVCGCLALLSASVTGCQRERGMQGERDDQPQHFASQEEAVRKAIADFAEVLRSGAGVQLGVDVATLERAQPGPTVRRVDLDFTRLLTADSATTFDQLVASERNLVVPLIADGDVATIVEVVRDDAGWRVVGLAGQDIASDLSAVLGAAGDTAASITLYEVPNLQARVYGVATDAGERLHTDYQGRFSIRQGVDAATLLPVLRADAQTFERTYGDSARAGRLLR